MANNHLLLYCKKCLECTIIAKYYPIQWYCGNEEDNPIHDFLVEHSEKCWEKDEKVDVHFGTNMFDFKTVLDDDKFEVDFSKRPYKLNKKNIYERIKYSKCLRFLQKLF